MQILNETYFGKNKNLLEMEKLIGIIKDTLEKDPYKNVNKMPENKKIRELIQKEFGFQEVKLVINPDRVAVNACTLTFIMNKKVGLDTESLKMIVSKNGIRYANSKDKIVYIEIFSGFIIKLTPPQVVAALLHEIGHNFYIDLNTFRFSRLDNFIINYTRFCKEFRAKMSSEKISLKNFIKILNNNLKIRTILNKINKIIYEEDEKIIKNTKKIEDFEQYVTYIEAYLNYNYDLIVKDSKEREDKEANKNGETSAAYKIFFGICRTLALPFRLISFYLLPFNPKLSKEQLIGRENEKFADNFAASYGYGQDFAEIEKNVFMPMMKDYMGCKLGYLLKYTLFANWKMLIEYDEHPSDLSRMRFIKNKLEYELKNNSKDLTPKQIDEIKKQLAEIIDLIDNNKGEVQKAQEEFEKLFDNPEERIDSQLDSEAIYDFDKKFQTEYKVNDEDHKNPTARDI